MTMARAEFDALVQDLQIQAARHTLDEQAHKARRAKAEADKAEQELEQARLCTAAVRYQYEQQVPATKRPS